MRCGHCKGVDVTREHVWNCSSATPKTGLVTIQEVEHELQPTGALWGWNDGVRAVKPSEVRREQGRMDLFAEINKIGRDIPTGRYAIKNGSGAANDLSFYNLEKPETGKWAGKVFLKQQLSDEWTRVPAQRQLVVLTEIAANPAEASARYGMHIGSCGLCGRTLTNEESREYGIGPKCRMKQGW